MKLNLLNKLQVKNTADDYPDKYLIRIAAAKGDNNTLKCIINEIYQDGYEDGGNSVQAEIDREAIRQGKDDITEPWDIKSSDNA